MTVPAFPREHLLGALREAAKFKDHSQRIVILQKWEVEDILLAWDAKCADAETRADELEAERDRLRERLDQFEAYAITVSSALADRAYVEALGNELALTRGAMAADDARLRAAAIRVWGEDYHGCDTPDAMADYIEHLRDRLSEETDPNAPQRRAPGTGAMRRAMPNGDEGGE